MKYVGLKGNHEIPENVKSRINTESLVTLHMWDFGSFLFRKKFKLRQTEDRISVDISFTSRQGRSVGFRSGLFNM